MLDTWNESIFSNIKNRLQDSAMKLVHAERLGEAFDSQLVIGVRESYGERAELRIQESAWVHRAVTSSTKSRRAAAVAVADPLGAVVCYWPS